MSKIPEFAVHAHLAAALGTGERKPPTIPSLCIPATEERVSVNHQVVLLPDNRRQFVG
jgi:hypothetical protein